MEQNTQDKTKQRNSIKLNEKSKNKKRVHVCIEYILKRRCRSANINPDCGKQFFSENVIVCIHRIITSDGHLAEGQFCINS